jgi:HSP20 family molecular chaperone IbpA
MLRKADPNDWMWAHACELISRAERMHRQFFRLDPSVRSLPSWQAPADVFEDAREVVVVVALPGVAADRVEISTAPGELVVRAERPIPFTGLAHAVRRLEIPYGHFECRIPLPEGRLTVGSPELTHGCLVLRLRKEL